MVTSETYSEVSGIVGTLQDGRTIAKGTVTQILPFVQPGQPPFFLQVNIPNLNKIDAILDIEIKTLRPRACAYGICDKSITPHATQGYPVVGFTLVGMTYLPSGNTATGVTVTAEVVAVGW